MPRGPQLRLTTRTVIAIEAINDHLDASLADGVIDLDEQRHLRELAGSAYQQSLVADTAVQRAVTYLRVGPDSRWAQLQEREQDDAA